MDGEFASIDPWSETAAIVTVFGVLVIAWGIGLFFHSDQ
jgi:hypothetical protein